MTHPNEGTAWEAQDGQDETALDLKEPACENDPNIGTRWADPPDSSKPREKVIRPVDLVMAEAGDKSWTCPACGFGCFTETGKEAHLKKGSDGFSPCERDRKNFKSIEICAACKGAGQIQKEDCRACAGTGMVGEEKCRNCGGRGQVTDCQVCGGIGRRQKADESAAAIDPDALARKIAEPIVATMKEGFGLLLTALKPPEKCERKKGRPRASTGSVRGKTAPGGSKPVSGVEQPDQPVADSPSGSEQS